VWKYVDDMNLVETRKLNQPSSMQKQLGELSTWTSTNDMLLNDKKYVVMHVTSKMTLSQPGTLVSLKP
jgi:hypothetical protein